MKIHWVVLFLVLKVVLARKEDCFAQRKKLILLDNVFYYFHADSSMQRDSAAQFCHQFGMSLMDLSTPDRENTFARIIQLAKYAPRAPYWTSGVRVTGEWRWSNTPLGLHLNWQVDEPTPNNDVLVYNADTSKWRTAAPDSAFFFICSPPL